MSNENNDLGKYRVPAFCPLCDEPMKGNRSNDSFYEWGCCYGCFIDFIADGREEKWRSGWRPAPEDISRARSTS